MNYCEKNGIECRLADVRRGMAGTGERGLVMHDLEHSALQTQLSIREST
jgi:hypothetical protein